MKLYKSLEEILLCATMVFRRPQNQTHIQNYSKSGHVRRTLDRQAKFSPQTSKRFFIPRFWEFQFSALSVLLREAAIQHPPHNLLPTCGRNVYDRHFSYRIFFYYADKYTGISCKQRSELLLHYKILFRWMIYFVRSKYYFVLNMQRLQKIDKS